MVLGARIADFVARVGAEPVTDETACAGMCAAASSGNVESTNWIAPIGSGVRDIDDRNEIQVPAVKWPIRE